MARLADTQLVILSAASQREDRGVELPENVAGKAAGKIVDKLIRENAWSFFFPQRAQCLANTCVLAPPTRRRHCRPDDCAARRLIRLPGLLEEVRASGSLPVWRRDDESGAIALRITGAGLAATSARAGRTTRR